MEKGDRGACLCGKWKRKTDSYCRGSYCEKAEQDPEGLLAALSRTRRRVSRAEEALARLRSELHAARDVVAARDRSCGGIECDIDSAYGASEAIERLLAHGATAIDRMQQDARRHKKEKRP